MSAASVDPAHDEPCSLLKWDSEFFGFPIARVNAQTITDTSARVIDNFCQQNAVRLIYFLARSDVPETTRAAGHAGFNLVDIRLTFERSNLPNGEFPQDIRPVSPNDYAALEEIAATAHTDTRFYFDGHMPRQKCNDLYRCWIRRSCEGWAQMVFVTGPGGSPTGYVTCHANPQTAGGSIGLIAVRADSRDAGLAGKLVTASLTWFSQQGLKTASVVTQGRNISAQRLYQHNQFVTRSLELYYHKWYG